MWPFKKKDKVFLVMHDGKHPEAEVEWIEGVPYAASYLPETRCLLLPNGEVLGLSFIYGWFPATPAMTKYHGNWPQRASAEKKP